MGVGDEDGEEMRAVKHTWLSVSTPQEHLTPPAPLHPHLMYAAKHLHKQSRAWTAVRATEPWQMDKDLSFWPCWLNHCSSPAIKATQNPCSGYSLKRLSLSQLVSNKKRITLLFMGCHRAPGSFNSLIVLVHVEPPGGFLCCGSVFTRLQHGRPPTPP